MTQTAATIKKPSRATVNNLARDLGYVLGEKATTELINQAMGSTDPEEYVRRQAAAKHEALSTKSETPANTTAEDAKSAKGTPDPVPFSTPSIDKLHNAGPAGPSVVIELPLGMIPTEGYARRFHKVELGFDREQAAIFQRLYYGLNSRSTRLASGKHVESAADVVRYMLEQAAAAAGA